MKTKFKSIWTIVKEKIWFDKLHDSYSGVKDLYKGAYDSLTEEQRLEMLNLEKEELDLLYKYGDLRMHKTTTRDVLSWQERVDAFYKKLLPKDKLM